MILTLKSCQVAKFESTESWLIFRTFTRSCSEVWWHLRHLPEAKNAFIVKNGLKIEKSRRTFWTIKFRRQVRFWIRRLLANLETICQLECWGFVTLQAHFEGQRLDRKQKTGSRRWKIAAFHLNFTPLLVLKICQKASGTNIGTYCGHTASLVGLDAFWQLLVVVRVLSVKFP